MPSSTPHAKRGESSSLNPKSSPPSGCATGPTSVSRYDVWFTHAPQTAPTSRATDVIPAGVVGVVGWAAPQPEADALPAPSRCISGVKIRPVLTVDRKTVRTYIAKGLEQPAYKKRAPAPSVIDRFEPFRYIREDFFLGGAFRNLDDLNEQLRHWLDTVANLPPSEPIRSDFSQQKHMFMDRH